MSLQSTSARKKQGICLLSIDAGGSRGISELKILADLMHRRKFDGGHDTNDLPCFIFDMIGGVGSGGFIALILSVLRLTAEQALEEFIELSSSVLDLQGVDATARTAALKQFINNLLKKYEIDTEACLINAEGRPEDCKVVVPISYKYNVGSLCTLRNFRARQEQPLNLTIAEALLATLATPPLFNSSSIFKESATFDYIGADLTLSNSVQELINEAYGIFGPEETVACLLSLGCGDPGIISVPEDKQLASWNDFVGRLLMDSEQKAQSFHSRMGHLGLYHRFSVTRGLENSVGTSAPIPGHILAHTAAYLADVSVSQKVDLCLVSLKARDGLATLEQLNRSGGQIVPPTPLPPVSRMFVMRDEPWNFMEKVVFGKAARSEVEGPRMLVVTGIGGCGKTQLVLKFMRVHEARFASRFVIDGSSESRIRADTIRHVRSLGVEHSQKDFDECLLFLAQPSPNGPRLILYDNVDDPDIELGPLMPQGELCITFITSRNRSVGELCPDAHLELDVMSIGEAVELLMKSPNGSIQSTANAREGAVAIAEALGCLPIALTQARSYMYQAKCSASAYLERLISNRDRLLAQPVKNQRDMRYLSTYAAFEASFAKLPLRVQRLLRLLSCFHWNKFPLELIVLAAKHNFADYEIKYIEHGEDFYTGKDILESIFLTEGKWSVMDLDDMMVALQNYSLITLVSGVDTMLTQMHPLVHAWINSCITEQERSIYQSSTVLLLALGSREDHNPADQYLPSHVTHLSSLWSGLNLNNAQAFSDIFHVGGQLQEALPFAERVLFELKRSHPMASGDQGSQGLSLYNREVGDQIPGDQDLGVATASAHLGDLYRSLGRLKEAALLQEEDAGFKKTILGERHPDTIRARDSLALTYSELGRLDEAEKLQVEGLKFRKEILGENHIDTFTTANNLALNYYRLGRLEEAKSLQEDVLKKSKELLGSRHPFTIQASINLAAIYSDLGRDEEAEAIETEMLRLTHEIHGPRHPDTLAASSNLAQTYSSLRRLEEAEALQVEVVKLGKEIWGERHPYTLMASNNLALIYSNTNRNAEAESILKDVIRLRIEISGEQHPDTIMALNNLACIYRETGRVNEAIVLHANALSSRREILGDRHPDTLLNMLNLAEAYESLGKKNDALELLATAKGLISDALGDSHPLYIRCQKMYNHIGKSSDQRAESEEENGSTVTVGANNS